MIGIEEDTTDAREETEGRIEAADQTDGGASSEGKAEGSRSASHSSSEGRGKSEEGKGSGEGSRGESESQNEVVDPKLEEKRRKDREKKAAKRAAAKAAGGVVPMDVLPTTPSSAKKKESAAAKAKSSNLTAEYIARQIHGSHELLALFLGDEARIDQASSVMLGEAVYEVIKEYDLAFIGKYGKWAGLITAAAIVEVPVVMRLREKHRQQSAVPVVQQAPAPVFEPAAASPIPGVAMGVPG